nr:MAG TPA: hypothetical protein [Caudoviricetes sp.]
MIYYHHQEQTRYRPHTGPHDRPQAGRERK